MVYAAISNMPTTANYREVRIVFSGMEIPREGMKLINDKYGERIVPWNRLIRASESYEPAGPVYGPTRPIGVKSGRGFHPIQANRTHWERYSGRYDRK